MEIYFYCSYENSSTGFFLTRLENEQLVAADFSSLPPVVEEFFSYDRFRFLWRDLCHELEKTLEQPEITGSFCGIREMKGNMRNGRSGTVNMAIYANANELTLMRRVVLSILGDFDAFREMLFQWLSAGGDCSYQLDGAAFRRWLEECSSHTHLRRFRSSLLQRGCCRVYSAILHPDWSGIFFVWRFALEAGRSFQKRWVLGSCGA